MFKFSNIGQSKDHRLLRWWHVQKNMFKVKNIFICCNLMKQKPLLKAFYFQFLKINIWMLFNIEKSMDHPPLRWWNVPEQCFFFHKYIFYTTNMCSLTRTKNLVLKDFIPLLQKTIYFVQYWESDYHPPLPWWNVRTYNSFSKKNKAIRFSKNGVKLWAKVFVCITLRSIFMFFPNGVKVWAK